MTAPEGGGYGSGRDDGSEEHSSSLASGSSLAPGARPSAPIIAVLDYGVGNLRSAQKALEHLGADARLVNCPEQAVGADGVVLPGVAHFGRCAEALRSSGLEEVALTALQSEVPFLGICVGFQLLYEGSEEAPGIAGLGVLKGTVRALSDGVKRPQMQWNRLDRTQARGAGLSEIPGSTGGERNLDESKMLRGLGDEPWVYFVHSFSPFPAGWDDAHRIDSKNTVVATCDYGGPVVAAVESGPIWGTQFHPEKSSSVGLAILANFIALVSATGRGDV